MSINFISPFFCIIIGKRNSGRTTLVKDITKNFNFIFISTHPSDLYSEHKYYTDSDPVWVTNCNDGIVLDNCLWNRNIYYKYKNYFFNKNIITTQNYLQELPQEFWKKANYFFVFKENNTTDQIKLYENIFKKYYYTFKDFQNAQNALELYECIVLDKNNNYIFTYKSKKI